MVFSRLFVSCTAITALISVGCKKQDLMDDDSGPPTVVVVTPAEREVTQHAEYIGRIDAVNSVEIKARVTGYLTETPFAEGSEVKKGEVLCVVDPRPYQAQLDAAKGELSANEAKYKLAKTENERAKSLYQDNPKAISQKTLDQHQAEEDAAAAAVVASRSGMEVYELDLEFTEIHSPIDGRIGRYEVTVGNLVTENTSTLTTVVSQDPIYVYFDVDEATMRKLLKQLYSGELPSPATGKVKVGMALPDQAGFPHVGTIDFANNTVDPSTGTISLRASFANPANDTGIRLLIPGMFVRVRMPLSRPTKSVLVPQKAIGTDQGQKFVYVVNDQDMVEYRRVTLGQLQADGLLVITEGIKSTDRIVTGGLQLVRPKMKVNIKPPVKDQAQVDAGGQVGSDSPDVTSGQGDVDDQGGNDGKAAADKSQQKPADGSANAMSLEAPTKTTDNSPTP